MSKSDKRYTLITNEPFLNKPPSFILTHATASVLFEKRKRKYKTQIPKIKKGTITRSKFRQFKIEYLAKNTKCPFSYKALLLSDFTIPAVLDLHHSRSDKSKPEMYFSLFGSLLINKRVLSCTYHVNEKIYEYLIADRVPLHDRDNGIRDLAKIFEFLRKFEDPLTKNLQDVIIDWLCYSSYTADRYPNIVPNHNECLLQNSEVTEQIQFCENDHQGRSFEIVEETEIKFQTILSPELLEKIGGMPRLVLEETFDQISGHRVRSFSHSKSIMGLLGVEQVVLSGELEGFHVVTLFRSRNWVLQLNTLFIFQMDHAAKECKLSREAQHIENVKGDILLGKFSLYKSVHIKNNVLYHKTYFVYKIHSPTKLSFQNNSGQLGNLRNPGKMDQANSNITKMKKQELSKMIKGYSDRLQEKCPKDEHIL